MLDLNTKPYFDDYNEDKGFHRVLYRPSFSVQARELNQMQSILQDQIKRFGNHMFKNGSMIKPGAISFDASLDYVQLETTMGTAGRQTAIDVLPWLGKDIIGTTSGVKATVINAVPATKNDLNVDPPTFYIKILESGSRVKTDAVTGETYTEFYDTFIDGEEIAQVDNETNKVRVKISVSNNTGEDTFYSSGKGCGASIDEGIYFINGYFVKVQKQSIIIDKYNNAATAKVGLRLYDTIVTPEMDPSLQDNSQGSYNYAAPGAHRYKMTLKLEWVPYTPDDFTDTDSPITNEGDHFIMLLCVVNGEVTYQCEATEYGELERTLARRTYDESGNYTVQPFMLTTYEHLKNPNEEKYALGRYEATHELHPGDKNKIAIQMSPGKAYVLGFERHKKAPTWLEVEKARETRRMGNVALSFNIGNYVYVTRMFQLPDIKNFEEVNFFTRDITVDGDQAAINPVGTARVRAVQLESKASRDPKDYIYRLYLFNVQLSVPFSEVKSIQSGAGASSQKTFTCSTVIDTENQYAGYAGYTNQLLMQHKQSSIFKLPHDFIATLNVGGEPVNENDTTFTTQSVVEVKPLEGSTTFEITINEGENYLEAKENWIIFDTSASTASNSYVPIENVETDKDAGVCRVTLGRVPVGKLRCFCPVTKSVTTAKQKILQYYASDEPDATRGEIIENPSEVITLSKADGAQLISIWEGANPTIGGKDCVDITDHYTFDGGQRDTHYGPATLTIKPGFVVPQNKIIVRYTYYQHSPNGDYFTVDSYYRMNPGEKQAVKLDYEYIPSFTTSNGEVFNLADCIDFRPILNNYNLAGATVLPNSEIRVDYDYYLGRIDKVYINSEGKFGIIKGIADDHPVPPETPQDSMLLWKLHFDPYTASLGSIRKEYVDNKRFTMRDIGKLETRIENLEYYVSLSLLEIQTLQMQITDTDGNSRFKNGFIVDPFQGHNIGAFGHLDYKCSVDVNQQELRPTFSTHYSKMNYVPEGKATDGSCSYHVQRTSSLVTLPYTNVPFIEQPQASTWVNVNPFAVRAFAGVITFQPDSDQWFEKTKVGDKIVDYSPNYEALEYIASHAEGLDGTYWGDWYQTGSQTTSTSTTTTSNFSYRTSNVFVDAWHRKAGIGAIATGTKQTTTTNWTTVNTYQRDGKIVSHEPVVTQTDFGDRTVGISDIQYMRELTILLKCEQMKPNTRVYAFFDDVDVNKYCTPCPVVNVEAGEMKDANGNVGAFFHTDDTVEEYLVPVQIKDKIQGKTDINEIITIAGLENTDFCQVLFCSHNMVPERDADGNIVKDANGIERKVFNFSQITVVNWRGSADTSVSNKIGAGTTLYGVKSGCTCKLAEDIVALDKGGEIVTSKAGTVALLFDLPNNDEHKFKTGERLFVLTDQVNNSQASQTRAKGKFTSRGYDLQQEGTIVSTKSIQFTETPISENRKEVINWTTTSSKVLSISYYDPLAQSFVVDIDGGIFVTAINICIATKDDTLPIICSLLEMDNGFPTQSEVPYSRCVKYPDSIVTCEDPRKDPFVWTRFEMEAPVYLKPHTEYCIFLMSDSFDYHVWAATLGENDLRTGKYIGSQPYDGVIFKSQNASTWTEDQEQDLCFCIERANFDISQNGIFYADNEIRPAKASPVVNCVESFLGSKLLRFHSDDHGLCPGSVVTISGFENNTTYNGIDGAAINGQKVVIQSELDSFLVEAKDSANPANMNGRNAEAHPVFDTNVPYQTINPNIANIVLDNTRIEWAYRYTKGQSVSGFETAYEQPIGFLPMTMQEDNFLPETAVLCSESNRLANGDTGGLPYSLRFMGVMSSDLPNISPVIDLNRTGTVLVNNRVDHPTITQTFPKIKFVNNSNLMTVTTIEKHIMADGSMVYFDCSDAEGELQTLTYYDEITGAILRTVTKENDSPTLFPVKDPKGVSSNNGVVSGQAAGRKTPDMTYAVDLEGWYSITRIDDYTFTITLPDVATDNLEIDLSKPIDAAVVNRFNITDKAVSMFISDSHYRYVPENKPINCSTASRYFTQQVTIDKPSTAAKIMFTCSATGPTDFEIWCRTQNQYSGDVFSDLDWFRVVDPSFNKKVSSSMADFHDYECTIEFTDGSGEDDLNEFTSIAVKIVMMSTDQTQVPLFKNLRVICLAT